MRRTLTLALLSTVLPLSIYAQPSPSFEAVTVYPSDPSSVFESKLTRSQFIATRHTLQMLIQSSYADLPQWRMSGAPAWASTDLWDFVAKLPAGAPADQERLYRATEQMLRNFLAEEFKLKAHFVQKQQPVYYLIAAKGGPKLKPSEGDERSARYTARGLEVRHETMQEFASSLFCPNCAREGADLPVFDKTGLSGYYDLTLNWSPSNSQLNTVPSGPSIFTALEQQLGLKLEPRKAAVDFLVIDQAERPPQKYRRISVR